MSLTEKDIIKLDWQSEYGATLETHELLEVLAKIAEDPEAYTWAEFDAGYTRAEQLTNALRGMMGGLRAAEIAKTFKRAVKAREACEKYGLVPMATLEHAQQQLRAVGAMNVAIEARAATMAPGADQIGPGYPEPPPPPPTKAVEWTGELVFERIAPQGLTNPVGYRAATPEEQAELERMARAINRNSPPYPMVSGEALYAAMQSLDGGKLNRAMSCAWVMLGDATREYFNAVAAKLSP